MVRSVSKQGREQRRWSPSGSLGMAAWLDGRDGRMGTMMSKNVGTVVYPVALHPARTRVCWRVPSIRNIPGMCYNSIGRGATLDGRAMHACYTALRRLLSGPLASARQQAGGSPG